MSIKKNLPNYLTYFRIAVIPALIAVFFFPGDWTHYVAATLFGLACFTDWLDGYVARIFEAHSNIGRFLDPIADKLLVATVLVLLVWADRAHVLPAIAIVCREILVSGLREFLACLHVPMPVSRLAKWKTGFQMTAIWLLLFGPVAPMWIQDFSQFLLWVAALLTLITGYAYLKIGLKHMMEDGASH